MGLVVLFVITVSWFIHLLHADNILIPPTDVVCAIGQDITLTCEADSFTGNNMLEWRAYTNSSAVSFRIFVAPPVMILNEEKYGHTGKYSLIVRDTALTDGGGYQCHTFVEGVHFRAELIVIEEPKVIVSGMVEDTEAQLSCTGRFGGPATLDDNHRPDMSLTLDGEVYEGVIDRTPGQPGPPASYVPHSITKKINFTATSVMSGKEVICRVHTPDPAFSLQHSHILDVQFAVRGMDIAPLNSEYYRTEVINCTAEGNPPPTFRWVPIQSPGPINIPGPQLSIEAKMAGFNRWECQATNDVHGIHEITQQIEFDVVPGLPPGSNIDCAVTSCPLSLLVISVAFLWLHCL